MLLTDRHNHILEILENKGQVTVDELVEVFKVTPQTIRSNLNDLGKANKLIRVHGGAMSNNKRENVEYESRRKISSSQKVSIGQAAANIIPHKTSLFINIGTTTEAFSDAIFNHKGLLVITNNINVANSLRLSKDIEVIIAGGVVRSSDGGIVGDATVEFIENFKVDYAIIGSSAIDPIDGSLLDYDFQEVKVAQAIIEKARHVILVADSTKFDRSAPIRIGHISQVDTFITDVILDDELRQFCKESNVTIIETDNNM